MKDTVNILSFPGLGIDEFSINTVAFPFFGRNIVWYGIIVTLGIIAGFLYTTYRSKHEDIKSDDILDIAIYAIVSAMVGARLYYVVMNLDHYNTFLEVIAIWNGGIAIYGGIIGGALAVLIVAKIKKLNAAKIYDMIAPGLMLGQIIGRWGNFVNAEAFGTQTTLPWRMGLHKIGKFTYNTPIYVHPTFLYESIWNTIGFILINLYYKKKKYNGQIFLLYIVWYGFGRMFIEGLRTDSLMIGDFIRVSQLLAFLSAITALVLLAVFDVRDKNQIVTNNATYKANNDKTKSASTADKAEEAEEAEEYENECNESCDSRQTKQDMEGKINDDSKNN